MHNRPKVLIVEDDPFIAMDIEIAFVDAGYDIIGPAADVSSALKLIEEDRPNCASLDYNLGSETSAPVASRLEDEGVKFVFVTGSLIDLMHDHKTPGSHVINKPVDPNAIVKALQG